MSRALFTFTAFTFCAVVLFSATEALAHPGGTDTSGGHYCRTNCAKWGLGQDEYHKHNAGGYTNSKGQQFDKVGNPVGGNATTQQQSSSSQTETQSKPSPTPAAASQPSPAVVEKPAVTTVPSPSPEPSPSPMPEDGDVLGVTEEGDVTEEEATPSPTSQQVTSTPSPVAEPDDGGGSGMIVGLITLAILGGGGYYLVCRSRRKG